MKKAYIKPELAVESFVLSQSVAAACIGATPGAANATLWSSANCMFFDGADFVFTTANGCDIDAGTIDEECYNISVASSMGAFHS